MEQEIRILVAGRDELPADHYLVSRASRQAEREHGEPVCDGAVPVWTQWKGYREETVRNAEWLVSIPNLWDFAKAQGHPLLIETGKYSGMREVMIVDDYLL